MAEPDDPRVAALLREEKLGEAAALLAQAGQHARASELFERDCAFGRAATEALSAGAPRRALLLAARAEDGASPLAQAIEALASRPDEADRAASEARGAGHARVAARLLERIGRLADAAEAFEQAGDLPAAARAWTRVPDPVRAARALEAQLASQPGDHAARVALGALLLEHDRAAAAARVLQQVPAAAGERAAALPLLARALASLGMDQAREHVRAEIRALGLDPADGSRSRAASSRPPAARPSPPGPARSALFGRYAIAREVAVTPTARVLEAQDTLSGARVAVKLLAAGAVSGAGRDAVARFEREARALGALHHPNVVPLVAYVPEGPALVLGWMAGGSLVDLRERGPVTPARAVEITSAVLGALGAAHRLGIVHRDVKPSNVLFDEAGVARLSDFGAAHVGDVAVTATAGVIGTIGYMSPEQRAGRPATAASDVYGAGAILYETLTGEAPAPADAIGVPPSAKDPELGPEHDSAVLALLARDPADRPGDATAAIARLASVRWPTRGGRAAPKAVGAPATQAQSRLLGPGPERFHDAWLDRDVRVLPLDDATLARARAFACAGAPALATIFRVDPARRELWVEPGRGVPLASGANVDEVRLAELRAALAALHDAGAVHGAVDAAHVFVDGGALMLAFEPVGAAGATPDDDLRALAYLCAEAAGADDGADGSSSI